MTAWRWTAADGTTGRLTGRAAVVVARMAESRDWADQVTNDGHLVDILHGAGLGVPVYSDSEQLWALGGALLDGPVTLEREPIGGDGS